VYTCFYFSLRYLYVYIYIATDEKRVYYTILYIIIIIIIIIRIFILHRTSSLCYSSVRLQYIYTYLYISLSGTVIGIYRCIIYYVCYIVGTRIAYTHTHQCTYIQLGIVQNAHTCLGVCGRRLSFCPVLYYLYYYRCIYLYSPPA